MARQSPRVTLKGLLQGVRPGNPIGHRNLTLVPLEGERHGRLDYVLAADALAGRTLTITETSEGGSVPELLAANDSDHPVLLLDGEELVGAKQNRILNTSVLLAARCKTRIPVSCVEQGRWRYVRPHFEAGAQSPAEMRARASRQVSESLRRGGRAAADQSAVWDAVAGYACRLEAHSPTMALHDLVEQRRGCLDAYIEALPYPAGARGVVAAIGGRFAAMDLFDRAETLHRGWPRLVGGYALDAIGRAEGQAKPFSAKAAETLLEHVGELPCMVCPTAGLGQDWRFEAEGIVGQALVVENVCVHASAFPNLGPAGRDRDLPPLSPPSRRGRGPGRPDAGPTG